MAYGDVASDLHKWLPWPLVRWVSAGGPGLQQGLLWPEADSCPQSPSSTEQRILWPKNTGIFPSQGKGKHFKVTFLSIRENLSNVYVDCRTMILSNYHHKINPWSLWEARLLAPRTNKMLNPWCLYEEISTGYCYKVVCSFQNKTVSTVETQALSFNNYVTDTKQELMRLWYQGLNFRAMNYI